MKAIVTGATGFLGRHLVESLLNRGDTVIALGRNEKIGAFLESIGCSFVKMDLENNESVIAAIEPADCIYHCAALSSAWGNFEDFYKANVLATDYLLKACSAKAIKKFIYVSSSSIYFDNKDHLNIDESSKLPNRFINHYAKSKYLAEQAIINHCDSALQTIIIRPRGIIGEFDSAIMPRVLRLARQGRFPLFNNGNALVDVTYVKNVVHALLLCADNDNLDGESINISNDEPTKVIDLLEQVFAATRITVEYRKLPFKMIEQVARLLEFWSSITDSNEPVITRYSIALLAKSQTLNIEKAKRLIGYSPQYTLKEGIDRYASWLNQQTHTRKDQR